MIYRIKLTAQAKRGLKEIKSLHQNAIESIFGELKENPFSGKPLTRELTGKYTFKVGPYRIIYTVSKKDRRIYVLTVGHRATIYE